MKYPRRPMFLGFNGDSVWLQPEGYPDDHPMVLAHPDLFTGTPPAGVAPPKRKRAAARPKKTATPSTAAQDD